MPLTRSQARKADARFKRRKISDPTIDRLPGAVIGCVGSFLTKTARVLLDVAISPSASECCNWNSDEWTTLDFANLEKDLASRLSDDDLDAVLRRIDAPATVKTLKLTGLTGVIGHGLRALSRSKVLRQADISLVGKHAPPSLEREPMISQGVVLPILENIVDTPGNSLCHIQLPKKWRDEKSPALQLLLDKYGCLMNRKSIGCAQCEAVIGVGDKEWISTGSDDRMLQEFSCYECTNHWCFPCYDDCCPYVCDVCEKLFCTDCVPTNYCEGCQKMACSECAPMEQCLECNCFLCCEPVETCSICDQTRCIECSPHNHCEGEGCNESNCTNCETEDNVAYCDLCWKEYCAACRLKEYRKNRDAFCVGCKAMLCNGLDRENESLRHQLEELQRRQPAV